jgi:hypothetical protein
MAETKSLSIGYHSPASPSLKVFNPKLRVDLAGCQALYFRETLIGPLTGNVS